MRPMIRRRTVASVVAFGFLTLAGAEPRAVGPANPSGPTRAPFDREAQEQGSSPGVLDVTFSGDGKQTTDFGGYDYGLAVAVQADGKILTAGSAGGDFAVTRYNTDGTLDMTFSDDGKQTTDVGGSDSGQAAAIQPDGKIVVVGTSIALAPGGEYPVARFALARYTPDGILDSSFGDDGMQTTGFVDGAAAYAAGVALHAGMIVVAGSSEEFPSNEIDLYPPFDLTLARYTENGILDTSFSGDGREMLDLGGSDRGEDVAVQADGKIVVAGSGLVRYNTDGTLDISFSDDGKVITLPAEGVAIQPDGKLVIAGTSDAPPACQTCADPRPDFALARYNIDGTLDTGFGAGGIQITDFGGWDYGQAIAIQPDGKIVVAGTSAVVPSDFGVARYNADGTLDTAFGRNGKQTTNFGGTSGGWDRGSDVAIQPNGEIVVVGTNDVHPACYCPDSRPDIALARYKGGSAPSDTTAPETIIVAGPMGTTNDRTPTLTFDSSEGGSTFECHVDDGAFSSCISPHTTSTLSDGPHTFEVRATNAAGNADPSPASLTFSVDTVPPETTITGGPKGNTSDSTQTFSFESSEGGSTFACTVDAAVFSSCNSPHTTLPLTGGSHTFQVRATDAAGNIDPTPASRSWTSVPDYRTVVQATYGLVSYWRFGEMSGTTAADARGANNGSYRNGVVLGRPGALLGDSNPSASFDGSSGFVSVADNASLDTGDSFTLEAWVKRSSTSQSAKTLLSKGSGAYRLSFVSNVLTLTKSDLGTIARATVSTTDTTGFHHVVATKLGATVRIYIDGVDRTGTVTNRTIANTSKALNIGRDSSGSEYFPGLIDEVAVYNVALSAAQVQQHFKASGR